MTLQVEPRRMQPDGLGQTAGSRLARRKARTRAAILEAAGALFRDGGYEETSIQQIAERADTGVGTLYGYFASKEEMLHEVLRQHSDEAIERYHAAVDESTPAIDRLCTALDTFAAYILENKPVLLAAFQTHSRGGLGDPQPMEWLVSAYGGLLEEGIGSGELRAVPIDATARTLVTTHLVAMLGLGMWDREADVSTTRRDLQQMTRAMLSA
ncbi:MAG: TetR family transcriptional regulator [Tepidiformaceae bacterium]